MSYNINVMYGGGQQEMHHVQNCEKMFIKNMPLTLYPNFFMNNQQLVMLICCSCIDHIFSITTIVNNYIGDYKHVFCAFIDFN